MKTKILCMILLISILVLFGFHKKEDLKFNVDNDMNLTINLVENYSLYDTFLLKNKNKLTINEFIKEYKPICFRKTQQGYYTILKINSDEKVFVFFDNNQLLSNVFIVDDFETKEDFEDIIINEDNIQIVMEKHKNYLLLPWSVATSTGYIVKDGIVIVGSLNDSENKKVDFIDFYSNDELSDLYDKNQLANILYILPIDKR